MKKVKILLFVLLSINVVIIAGSKKTSDLNLIKSNAPFVFEEGVVFVTTADSEHYPILQHLIKSIYTHHPHNLKQIAIFDLGFTEQERDALNAMNAVHVHDLEKINPHLFTKFQTRTNGKYVRGLYSWKPVAIKQALEMFPYIMYMDAAMTIKAPADLLFEYIKQNNYLLINCGHSIQIMCTQTAEKIFSINHDDPLLNESGLCGGFQILSDKVLDHYIYPVYRLASDINNFVDDGTAPRGFGFSRHDQLLFSLQARTKKMHIAGLDDLVTLIIRGKQYQFRIHDYINFKPGWWDDYISKING